MLQMGGLGHESSLFFLPITSARDEMRFRELDVGCRLWPGQEPAQITPTHYCPGPGGICFAEVVWAKQRAGEKNNLNKHAINIFCAV